MTQKIKNYAKTLLICSLSIIAISCSKDKAAPASEPQDTKQVTEVPGDIPDDFVQPVGISGNKYNVRTLPAHVVPPRNAWYPSEITPVMRPGDRMVSANGQYVLSFQSTDGNLVLSNTITGAVLWSINQKDGTYLMFHKDGNLIMHTANGYNWASNIYTAGKNYVNTYRIYIYLQDDGNLVMHWDGITYTEIVGATGTGGGVNSVHYGSMRLTLP